MAADPLEHDLEVAQRALSENDPAHALKHLSGAFARAPFNEQAHALLEAVAQRADILKNLEDDDHFVGTHLVRAFALRRLGRVDEAIIELAQSTEAFPDRGLETLLASWLVAATTEGRQISEKADRQIMRLLFNVGTSTIGINQLFPGEKALLAGFADLAAAYAAVPPRFGAFAASGILRRAGRFREALAVLDAPVTERKDLALTQKALTLRAMGEQAQSAEVFRAVGAMTEDSDDFAVEQARCWFVAGDFDRALELLKGPSAAGGNPEVVALADACRARPEGDRLAVLDGFRRAGFTPRLEPPSDATANVFRSTKHEFTPGSSQLRVGISGWESPSNRLLVALYVSGRCDVTAADYAVADRALKFDPLSVRRGLAHPLWQERDGIIVQAQPAPSGELRTAIARVAAAERMSDIWERAGELAKHLDASLARDIASALVYPPGNAEFLKGLPNILYRYMVAGCCVLAQLAAPWDRVSLIFEGLLFGPVDWTSGAAITALAELARRDADKAAEIRTLLGDIVSDLIPHSCEPRHVPLEFALHTLPGVPPETLRKLKAWRREVNGDGKAEDDSEAGVDPWVALAVSKDKSRWNLSCVWNIPRERQAATDGHRIHIRPRPHGLDSPQATAPAVEAARKDGKVTFPDMDKAVPPPSDTPWKVDADTLRTGLGMVVRTTSGDHASRVFLESQERVLTIGARTAQGTVTRSSVALKSPLTVGAVWLNPKYLLDAISGAEGTLRISVTDALSPVLIQRADDALAVIMPVRVDDGAQPAVSPKRAAAKSNRSWMWIVGAVLAGLGLWALLR
jgi:tetratricopeptide (TPR) repeat protein